MKTLIVNADDVGLSDAINEAVKECYRSAAITGSSVISCGRKFPEGSGMLREAGRAEAGVHLALTGGFTPCAGKADDVNTLLGDSGTFVKDYPAFFQLYFGKKLNPDEIYLELAGQIKKVMDEGIKVTHIDSHEHIHMLPGILAVVIKLAKEFDVPYIRVPLEKWENTGKKFRPKDLLRHAALKPFASRAKKAIAGAGLKCNDAFLGHFHSGRIDDDILCFMMQNLADGVNELAVHPGVASPKLAKDSPWHSNAPKELDALLNGRWREVASSLGVRLISHSEALSY